MLILKHQEQPQGIRRQVYRKTLQFLSENVSQALVHNFESDDELIAFIRQNDCYCICCTNELSPKTSAILKGLGIIQVVIGSRPALEETADIIIDPLLKRSEKHFAGPEYLLPQLIEELPVAEIAEELGVAPEKLSMAVKHNAASGTLLELVNLFTKLQWDSDFFGVNVGYLSCRRLTPNIQRHVRRFVRQEKIMLLEYLCNCHDIESVATAERNGYSFTDIRLTFERKLQGPIVASAREGYTIRKGVLEDLPKLKGFVGGIYRLSRYYFDTNFDRRKVEEFYEKWLEKAFLGLFDSYVYVLCEHNEPIGFCSVRESGYGLAHIGLFGIAPSSAGRGIGSFLLESVLSRLQQEGMEQIEVVTQGRNYSAIRLYERSGFVIRATELWYHKWFW
jgi:dTDP-4-amino-4,6-dideoxy-D-galactose acyltransferase